MRGLYYSNWQEVYTGNLALAVAEAGHHVTVVVREGAHEFGGRTADAEAFRIMVRNGVDAFHVLPGRYSSIKSAIGLQRLIASSKEPFDFIHVQPPADPRFLPVMLRNRTVLTLHEPAHRAGDTSASLPNNIVGRLYRDLPELIVVHTQSCFQALSPSEQHKAVIIPHGVSESHPGSSPDHATSSKTVLLFGRATQYKGIEVLLQAMREVWEDIPEARLRILASPGNAEHSVDLDARVDAQWDGFTEAELDAALAESHVVCLPYTSVSGSGVGARAYGAGKQIVASDLHGLREFVSSNELLARPGSTGDLARALKVALSRESVAQIVDPALTWPGVAAEHIRAYEALRKPG